MIATAAAFAVAVLVVATAGHLRPRVRRPDAPMTPSAMVSVRRPALRSAIDAARERRSTRRQPNPVSVAAWCDDLARHVRSGATLRDALATVTPSHRVTEAATAPIRLGLARGRSTAEAIDACTEVGPHLHLALRVIRTVAQIGGSSPIAIDRTAATLRQRSADHDERLVHAAQARLSAHVLTAVPLLMLAGLLATDRDVRAITAAPVGAACVAAGLTANVIGWLWMQRLVGAEG